MKICYRCKTEYDSRTPYCKSCWRQYQKEYRSDPLQRQKNIASCLRWRQSPIGMLKQTQYEQSAKCQAYRKEYKESGQKREANKTYYKTAHGLTSNLQYNHSSKGLERYARARVQRRIREQGIVCTLTSQEWEELLHHYNHQCAYCGCKLVQGNRSLQEATRDHIQPISKGGHHIKDNIVPACRSCNSKKHNRVSP